MAEVNTTTYSCPLLNDDVPRMPSHLLSSPSVTIIIVILRCKLAFVSFPKQLIPLPHTYNPLSAPPDISSSSTRDPSTCSFCPPD